MISTFESLLPIEETRKAIAAFRKANKLGTGGELDETVYNAIMEQAKFP